MRNEQPGLFGLAEVDVCDDHERDESLSQWFTPEWAAVALVERYFPSLCSADLVIEPSCGPGAFLKAIPSHVPAIGVEIDPALAEVARENTGRSIITGDFTSAVLPEGATAIIGNPPFKLSLFDRFLVRASRMLPELGRCGFLLPTYFFQTFGRVNKWNDHWSLKIDMVPRGLFPGLILPLAFCVFSKDARRDMIGFALYTESEAVSRLSESSRDLLKNGRPRTSVWRALVCDTLARLGGHATLDEMYRHIEPKRPTTTAFWKEKVRQQLQINCFRCGDGIWALNEAAA
jgi:hypothetical protein